MTRLLPSFADLMLLPQVLDPDASVSLEGERIVVTSDQARSVKRTLEAYPHLAVRTRSDTEIALEPLALSRERFVLLWPGGETLGVMRWPGGFVSLCSVGATLDAALEGDGVQLVRCRQGETVAEALEALATTER